MTGRKAVVFEAPRDGYGINQIADTAMTVGELIAFLQDFDEDTLFVLSHDRGYTYGSINAVTSVTTYEENEDGEFVEADS